MTALGDTPILLPAEPVPAFLVPGVLDQRPVSTSNLSFWSLPSTSATAAWAMAKSGE